MPKRYPEVSFEPKPHLLRDASKEEVITEAQRLAYLAAYHRARRARDAFSLLMTCDKSAPVDKRGTPILRIVQVGVPLHCRLLPLPALAARGLPSPPIGILCQQMQRLVAEAVDEGGGALDAVLTVNVLDRLLASSTQDRRP